ncbi:MAG: ABC transporter ATP-binding protein [Bacteroidaceae bacterium]
MIRLETNCSGGQTDADMKLFDKNNKQIFALFFSLLKANRLRAINNVVAGLAIVFLEFLFVWFTKLTIDIATNSKETFSFKTAAILLILTLLCQIGVAAWRSRVNAMLGARATNKLRLEIFSHCLSASWLSINKFHSADLVNRIEKDVSTLISVITDTLPNFIVVSVQFCGAFVFLYYMDKRLALLLIFITPFFLIASKLYVKKMRKLSRKIRKTDAVIQSQYQEGLHNRIVVKTIKNAANEIVRHTVKHQSTLLLLIKRKTNFSIVSNQIISLGFSVSYLAAFIWGAYRLSIDAISYGTLIAFVQLVGQIQRPLRSMLRFLPEIINALTSGERIAEIKNIDIENIKDDTENKSSSVCATTNQSKHLSLPIGVKIENLTFGYKGNHLILKNLCHDFKPASRTLISAPTGRGKTTLVRLMLSLFNPNSGKIILYDNNGRKTDATIATRTLFSYVPQGNTLFGGTIRSNLKIASPNATDEELYKVLKIADANFVFSLSKGLSSPCGENGVTLSEGQAQRICIARALLVNAPILLLDEATSALDPATETRVLNNIVNTYKTTTIICISHRPKAREFCPDTLELL